MVMAVPTKIVWRVGGGDGGGGGGCGCGCCFVSMGILKLALRISAVSLIFNLGTLDQLSFLV